MLDDSLIEVSQFKSLYSLGLLDLKDWLCCWLLLGQFLVLHIKVQDLFDQNFILFLLILKF